MTDLPANSIKPIRSPLSEWQKKQSGELSESKFAAPLLPNPSILPTHPHF